MIIARWYLEGQTFHKVIAIYILTYTLQSDLASFTLLFVCVLMENSTSKQPSYGHIVQWLQKVGKLSANCHLNSESNAFGWPGWYICLFISLPLSLTHLNALIYYFHDNRPGRVATSYFNTSSLITAMKGYEMFSYKNLVLTIFGQTAPFVRGNEMSGICGLIRVKPMQLFRYIRSASMVFVCRFWKWNNPLAMTLFNLIWSEGCSLMACAHLHTANISAVENTLRLEILTRWPILILYRPTCASPACHFTNDCLKWYP